MKKQTYILPFSAFLAGSFILLFSFALVRIYPFGEKALLTIDLSHQYVDFFNFLRQSFFGDPKNLIYSFSTALGGDTFGLTAYYLLSPLNVLILIFPESHLLEAVLAMTVIKAGLCSAFFAVFLQKEKLTDNFWLGLGFSLMYGLCSYSVVYSMCPMWLDGVILLPLVAAGAGNIARGKSPLLYSVTLILSILSNYYIGFMVCLFSALYFVTLTAIYSSTVREFMKKALRFGVLSLISGLCCAFLLLPVFYTLKSGRMGFYETDYSLYFNFLPLDFLSKLFVGFLDTVKTTDNQFGLPNIFAGVLSVLGLPAFFLNQSISKKERLCFGVLLAVLFLSMLLNPVNLLWHGMQEPYWYPYRFSFVFSFALVIISVRGLLSLRTLDKNRRLFVLMAGLLPFLLGAALAPYLFVLTTAVFIAAYIVVYCKGAKQVLVCAVILAEMTVSTVFYVMKINSTYKYESRDSYITYIKNVKELLSTVQDDTLYRKEKTVVRSRNDNMSLGTYGLAHYSSSFENNVNLFAKKMGFLQPRFYTIYKGATPLTDSLLGIKYVVSDKTHPFYPEIAEKNGLTLYQNPYALPLAFLSEGDCGDMNFTADPFDNQLRLLNEIAGNDTDVLIKEKAERVGYSYTVTATGDGPVFFYFKSDRLIQCDLFINGERAGNYFRDYIYPDNNYNIVYAGEYQKGELLTVTLTPPNGLNVNVTGAYFYRFDMEKLNTALKAIKKAEVTELYAGRIRITADSDSDATLFTTIPCHEGFSVTINGKTGKAGTAAGTFYSFPVKTGKTIIELQYTPQGLRTGIFVSAIFFLLLILALFLDKRVNSNTNL